MDSVDGRECKVLMKLCARVHGKESLKPGVSTRHSRLRVSRLIEQM